MRERNLDDTLLKRNFIVFNTSFENHEIKKREMYLFFHNIKKKIDASLLKKVAIFFLSLDRITFITERICYRLCFKNKRRYFYTLNRKIKYKNNLEMLLFLSLICYFNKKLCLGDPKISIFTPYTKKKSNRY